MHFFGEQLHIFSSSLKAHGVTNTGHERLAAIDEGRTRKKKALSPGTEVDITSISPCFKAARSKMPAQAGDIFGIIINTNEISWLFPESYESELRNIGASIETVRLNDNLSLTQKTKTILYTGCVA